MTGSEHQWTVRRGERSDANTEGRSRASEEETSTVGIVLPPPLWRYKWEDSLNGPLPEAAGSLADQILGTVFQALEAGTGLPLVAVRGDLGSGKSTLRELLRQSFQDRNGVGFSAAVQEVHVVEAGDRESGTDFARRLGDLATDAPVVALARPSTWEVALSELSRLRPPLAPAATATLLPFRDTAANVFSRCLERVCISTGLDTARLKELESEVRLLPDFLATPFYFELIAQALIEKNGQAPGNSSVLDFFGVSLERRMGSTTVDDLVELARNPRAARRLKIVIQGIVEEDGFRHDGYRNLVLAMAVAQGRLTIEELGASSNAVPAFRVLLEHLRTLSNLARQPLVDKLTAFVNEDAPDHRVLNPLYLQAAAAVAIDALSRGDSLRRAVQQRCLELLRVREELAQRIEPENLALLDAYDGPELSWDISDALTQVGDPRLDEVEDELDRFSEVESISVVIGTDHQVRRSDDAKPVRQYSLQEVAIGPVLVANFLVTNAEYDEFLHQHPEDYYDDAGRRWVENDPTLIEAISQSFDVVAPRCFWKELEVESAGSGKYDSLPAALKVARSRATRRDAAMLRDNDAASDERFSAQGKPVVGVTWWDAMAYCKWWEENRLPDLRLGRRAEVSLLSDWEWEAIRRTYFSAEDGTPVDTDIKGRAFPAHLRTVKGPRGREAAMRLFQPAHVGIFPRPQAIGPYDLVGNVWEWTRSRVFGKIAKDPSAAPGAEFGGTTWDDVEPELEQVARARGRDEVVSGDDPLAYRAVRGGSWFSSDENAAWDPAYRLCDPPYSSYWDLGFRIAIYPEGIPIG